MNIVQKENNKTKQYTEDRQTHKGSRMCYNCHVFYSFCFVLAISRYSFCVWVVTFSCKSSFLCLFVPAMLSSLSSL